jgi:hypothetical protein
MNGLAAKTPSAHMGEVRQTERAVRGAAMAAGHAGLMEPLALEKGTTHD